MNLSIRPMEKDEQLYVYAQSGQIASQCGLIGYLRGDMGSSGDEFFTGWDDVCKNLKTVEFVTEFDQVIKALRKDRSLGKILENRDTLTKYCHSHPRSEISRDRGHYGFRADTKDFSYMMKLIPTVGDYNMYIYAYKRDWLDKHLAQAKKGIRFITPDYKELFRIPDGDKIRILLDGNQSRDRTCRYIDDTHLETNIGFSRTIYHICEFAEHAQRAGAKVIPLRSSLPEECYATLPSTGELIRIRKGESGYYAEKNADPSVAGEIVAEQRNMALGVSKAQAAAMLCGSLFGWETPSADPSNYDLAGNPLSAAIEARELENAEGMVMKGF